MSVKKKLQINLLASEIFWSSIPLLLKEIAIREHFLCIYNDKYVPSPESLLDCDVFIDLSAITDINFYKRLDKKYQELARSKKAPLMIDTPTAIMNSMDKRKTHFLIPDLIPESYNLDGKNNEKYIRKFIDDKYVIIKDPFGWWAKGVIRLSPKLALKKYKESKGLIIQKYIAFEDGIGRILTLNYKNDFQIVSSYLRVPNSWRTGEGTESDYIQVEVNKDLYKFAKVVSQKSGIYLNGIDYIKVANRYYLLEVNVAPGFRDPYDEFNINTPQIIMDHIERHAKKR